MIILLQSSVAISVLACHSNFYHHNYYSHFNTELKVGHKEFLKVKARQRFAR